MAKKSGISATICPVDLQKIAPFPFIDRSHFGNGKTQNLGYKLYDLLGIAKHDKTSFDQVAGALDYAGIWTGIDFLFIC